MVVIWESGRPPLFCSRAARKVSRVLLEGDYDLSERGATAPSNRFVSGGDFFEWVDRSYDRLDLARFNSWPHVLAQLLKDLDLALLCLGAQGLRGDRGVLGEEVAQV